MNFVNRKILLIDADRLDVYNWYSVEQDKEKKYSSSDYFSEKLLEVFSNSGFFNISRYCNRFS
jgi:hypothetical protein